MKMELPKVINNISERVIDDLQKKLSIKSTVSVAAASFSIYAYEVLKDELERVDELRFIFTSPTFIQDKVKKEKREFCYSLFCLSAFGGLYREYPQPS